MKNLLRLSSISLLFAYLAPSAVIAEPYPLEYFAVRSSMSNVQVSPRGDRLAMLKILSREGNPVAACLRHG